MIREPGSFGIPPLLKKRRWRVLEPEEILQLAWVPASAGMTKNKGVIKKDLALPNPFLFTVFPYTDQMMVVVF